MPAFMVVAIALVVVLVGAGAHRALRGWRLRRRAAWELDRAAWQRWILQR